MKLAKFFRRRVQCTSPQTSQERDSDDSPSHEEKRPASNNADNAQEETPCEADERAQVDSSQVDSPLNSQPKVPAIEELARVLNSQESKQRQVSESARYPSRPSPRKRAAQYRSNRMQSDANILYVVPEAPSELLRQNGLNGPIAKDDYVTLSNEHSKSDDTLNSSNSNYRGERCCEQFLKQRSIDELKRIDQSYDFPARVLANSSRPNLHNVHHYQNFPDQRVIGYTNIVIANCPTSNATQSPTHSNGRKAKSSTPKTTYASVDFERTFALNKIRQEHRSEHHAVP